MRQFVVSTQFVSLPTLRAQLRCSDRDLRRLLQMPGIKRGNGGLIELNSARRAYALMRNQDAHQEHRSRVYG